MRAITCIENSIENGSDLYASFLIEPLGPGHGITVGNAIRRVLLADLTASAITGARINNLKHEFSVIEGLREDVLEVLLNLKDIVFKHSFSAQKNNFHPKLKAFLQVQGPLLVTAAMFNLPKDLINIMNYRQYVCAIMDTSELYLEIDIESGKGYRLTEDVRRKNIEETLSLSRPSTLLIDALFIPIRNVNYKIKIINDTKGNLKESLNLEILTNGSVTPARSLYEAIKFLMDLFYPFLITHNFFAISNELKKTKFETAPAAPIVEEDQNELDKIALIRAEMEESKIPVREEQVPGPISKEAEKLLIKAQKDAEKALIKTQKDAEKALIKAQKDAGRADKKNENDVHVQDKKEKSEQKEKSLGIDKSKNNKKSVEKKKKNL